MEQHLTPTNTAAGSHGGHSEPPNGEVGTPSAPASAGPLVPPPGALLAAPVEAPPASPSGAVCRCGAGPHPDDPVRCAKGHVIGGNTLHLVVGHTSAAFWSARQPLLLEAMTAVLRDAGYPSADEAPRALVLAAESIAQAALVRDAAFLRLSESGGPLSAAGRVRRAYRVWESACDRLRGHLAMVGLKREPRAAGPADPLAWLHTEAAPAPAPEAAAEAVSAAPTPSPSSEHNNVG
jgi:hypothetical protein